MKTLSHKILQLRFEMLEHAVNLIESADPDFETFTYEKMNKYDKIRMALMTAVPPNCCHLADEDD